MESVRTRVLAAAGCGAVLLALLWTIPLAATAVAVVVVLVASPVHPSLVGRVGPVFVAWVAVSQAAYVLPWPGWLPPRQAVGWVVAALIVMGLAARKPPPLPRVDPGTVGLAAFLAAAAWAWCPWRGDAVHVLDRMLYGWDNSGHYAMVEQLRLGLTAEQIGFPGYPRGYHATVASVMELFMGAPAPINAELVAYVYAFLTVLGIALALLVAQVLTTPGLRTRALLVAPAVAALITILLALDDASQAPYFGFVNFVVAACITGFALLLPYGWTRANDWSRWVLLGLCAASIVGLWTILLAFLVPIPLAVYLGRRGEPRLLRRTLLPVVVAAAPVLAAVLIQPSPARAAAAPGQVVSLSERLDTFLLLTGAITTSSLGWPIVFAATGLVAPLAYLVIRRRHGLRVPAAGWVWLSPAAALLMSAAMLLYEYARVGEARYYGVKVLCATTITAGSLGVAASGFLISRLVPRQPRRPLIAVVASALSAVVLLCCAGTPIPLPGVPLSPGATIRRDFATSRPEIREPLARGILGSCPLIAGKPGEYYLLTPATSRADLVRAGVWIITCGQSWSTDQTGVLRQLLPDTHETGGDTLIDLSATTKRILAVRPYAVVLVSKAHFAEATKGLDFAAKARVLAY